MYDVGILGMLTSVTNLSHNTDPIFCQHSSSCNSGLFIDDPLNGWDLNYAPHLCNDSSYLK